MAPSGLCFVPQTDGLRDVLHGVLCYLQCGRWCRVCTPSLGCTMERSSTGWSPRTCDQVRHHDFKPAARTVSVSITVQCSAHCERATRLDIAWQHVLVFSWACLHSGDCLASWSDRTQQCPALCITCKSSTQAACAQTMLQHCLFLQVPGLQRPPQCCLLATCPWLKPAGRASAPRGPVLRFCCGSCCGCLQRWRRGRGRGSDAAAVPTVFRGAATTTHLVGRGRAAVGLKVDYQASCLSVGCAFIVGESNQVQCDGLHARTSCSDTGSDPTAQV
jgi:hypothetical protein